MITLIQFLQSGIGISLLSAIIATLIPSPFDFLHFYLQNYIYTHKIKRLNFEILQVMDWYFLDSIYYALIFILAYLLENIQIRPIRSIKKIMIFPIRLIHLLTFYLLL